MNRANFSRLGGSHLLVALAQGGCSIFRAVRNTVTSLLVVIFINLFTWPIETTLVFRQQRPECAGSNVSLSWPIVGPW